jgi:hypothetical protein
MSFWREEVLPSVKEMGLFGIDSAFDPQPVRIRFFRR